MQDSGRKVTNSVAAQCHGARDCLLGGVVRVVADDDIGFRRGREAYAYRGDTE
mgnify:CR=1 FL=1